MSSRLVLVIHVHPLSLPSKMTKHKPQQ